MEIHVGGVSSAWPAGPKIAWCFCFSGLCVHTYHAQQVTSHTLLPRDFTSVELTADLSTDVATKSSLTQLWVWETEKRQCGNARSELLVMPTEKLND